MIIGSALLSLRPKDTIWQGWFKKIKRLWQPESAELRSVGRLWINALLSSFIFAAYYVLIKYLYDSQGFTNAFIWTRLGSFAGALLLLHLHLDV